MIRTIIFGCMLLLLSEAGYAQNVEYAREALHQLADKDFYGRGYVKNGDRLAAEYIASEFEKYGILPFNSNYFQEYTFSINTFPGKLTAKLDGVKLMAGTDFVISSSNQSIKGKFELVYLSDSIDSEEELTEFLKTIPDSNVFLVSKHHFKTIYGKTIQGIRGMVVLTEKTPFWHVSNAGDVNQTFWMKIRQNKLSEKPSKIYIQAVNEFVPNYKTQNVIGYVKGKKDPGRFIAYTAHYDHLGMMGKKTVYPGANDNGSGTAMLLDLARYYAKPENQPDKSIVFIAFSGEEAGLYGSDYYVRNPVFMLEAISLLINLDMVGTGSEGITIVNSIAYKELLDDMIEINEKNNYLSKIKERGESCNSDHCAFYNKGVKSIFIYTMGQEHLAYHTPDDTADKIPFTAYNGLFGLLIDYVLTLD